MLFLLYFLGRCLADNCYPCQTRLTIYEADFTSVPVSWFNGTNPKWTLDGTGTTSLGAKGLGFAALPYTEWACDPEPFFADHEKAKLQLNVQSFTYQHLYIEVELSGRTFGTENNPFPADMVHDNDLRLANCGISLTRFYPDTGTFHFMILLTNDRIYAVWETRQIITSLIPPPIGAVLAVPIARRCPEECHKVALEVLPDLILVDVKIWVDGRSVGLFSDLIAAPEPSPAIINNIAFLPEADPTPIYISFVHNTFLDGYSPCKDLGCCLDFNPCSRTNVTYGLVDTGEANEQFNPFTFPIANLTAQYWDNTGTDIANHIWGQGSELFVKSLLVRSVTSGCDA